MYLGKGSFDPQRDCNPQIESNMTWHSGKWIPTTYYPVATIGGSSVNFYILPLPELQSLSETLGGGLGSLLSQVLLATQVHLQWKPVFWGEGGGEGDTGNFWFIEPEVKTSPQMIEMRGALNIGKLPRVIQILHWV